MGLARNLRSLEWFDKIDMNTFFPRMYNLANPWEMQDFVEVREREGREEGGARGDTERDLRWEGERL